MKIIFTNTFESEILALFLSLFNFLLVFRYEANKFSIAIELDQWSKKPLY